MKDVLKEALKKYDAKTVGRLVFKDEKALQDFAKKNNMEIQYELSEHAIPEINPEKPSAIQPELKGILWAFEEEPQILVVKCLDESRVFSGVWTAEDERQLEWKAYIARLKNYYHYQSETLAVVEEMEKTYNGSQFKPKGEKDE